MMEYVQLSGGHRVMAEHVLHQCNGNIRKTKIFIKKELKKLKKYSKRREAEQDWEDAAQAITLAVHLIDQIIWRVEGARRKKYIKRNLKLINKLARLRVLDDQHQDEIAKKKAAMDEERDRRREAFVHNLKYKTMESVTEDMQKRMDSLKATVLRKPTQLTWDDVVGLEKEKEVLRRATSHLLECPNANPAFLAKGCLLFGPSGKINKSTEVRVVEISS